MAVVGNFPGCESLRAQFQRLVTYQFVHAGLQHITFNILIQVLCSYCSRRKECEMSARDVHHELTAR